ncbi:hypothetical protein PCG10_004738 [Penicillium crustosum]|uniref:Uncharacterized protein n=1 Tax=Penicillium crustosum TaxID=36656 RepID=A0A9P5GLZ0_PENCR|nr:uncharacterized protein N7487_006757 [Penicillium crustosum]KAF7525500.1 hypothetical protein PCG10_004738 [Penicillium crustosum]KAJ5412398.1 hypothetical protein N7487_006757 [Penicillium crustosum]
MPESIASRLFRGTRAILKYRKERGILVDNIRTYIATLRQMPEGNYLIEVALNVQSLKIQADKVKWASQDLAIEAADMAYVTSHGIEHFSRTIPNLCNEIGRDTRRLAETLHDHIHKPVVNTESAFIHRVVGSYRGRTYVIPNLRLQLIQHLDIVASLSMKMAIDSRHHPYVLVHQSGFYESVVPMHCAALRGQCAHLADRLRDNLNTDVLVAVTKLIDQIVANLCF